MRILDDHVHNLDIAIPISMDDFNGFVEPFGMERGLTCASLAYPRSGPRP